MLALVLMDHYLRFRAQLRRRRPDHSGHHAAMNRLNGRRHMNGAES